MDFFNTVGGAPGKSWAMGIFYIVVILLLIIFTVLQTTDTVTDKWIVPTIVLLATLAGIFLYPTWKYVRQWNVENLESSYKPIDKK